MTLFWVVKWTICCDVAVVVRTMTEKKEDFMDYHEFYTQFPLFIFRSFLWIHLLTYSILRTQTHHLILIHLMIKIKLIVERVRTFASRFKITVDDLSISAANRHVKDFATLLLEQSSSLLFTILVVSFAQLWKIWFAVETVWKIINKPVKEKLCANLHVKNGSSETHIAECRKVLIPIWTTYFAGSKNKMSIQTIFPKVTPKSVSKVESSP